VQGISLTTNAHVTTVFINYPEFRAFFLQNAGEHVFDAATGQEAWDGRVASLAAGLIKQFGNAGFFATAMGPNGPAQKVKQADHRNEPIRLTRRIDHRRNTASAMGNGPGFA
jgi:hypothetical protein